VAEIEAATMLNAIATARRLPMPWGWRVPRYCPF
jgi:hypothetical protein